MTQPFSDELISAYLDGELDADQRARVEQAMQDSVELRRMYDELRVLRHTLQSLPRCELQDDLVDRALQQMDSLAGVPGVDPDSPDQARRVERPDGSTSVARRRWPMLIGVVASVAAVLLVALWLPPWNASQVARQAAPPKTAADNSQRFAETTELDPPEAGRMLKAQPETSTKPTSERLAREDELKTSQENSHLKLRFSRDLDGTLRKGESADPIRKRSSTFGLESDSAGQAGGMDGYGSGMGGGMGGYGIADDAATVEQAGGAEAPPDGGRRPAPARSGASQSQFGPPAASQMGKAAGQQMDDDFQFQPPQDVRQAETVKSATVAKVFKQLKQNQVAIVQVGLNDLSDATVTMDRLFGAEIADLPSVPMLGSEGRSSDASKPFASDAEAEDRKSVEAAKLNDSALALEGDIFLVKGSVEQVATTLNRLQRFPNVTLSLAAEDLSHTTLEQIQSLVAGAEQQRITPRSAESAAKNVPRSEGRDMTRKSKSGLAGSSTDAPTEPEPTRAEEAPSGDSSIPRSAGVGGDPLSAEAAPTQELADSAATYGQPARTNHRSQVARPEAANRLDMLAGRPRQKVMWIIFRLVPEPLEASSDVPSDPD